MFTVGWYGLGLILATALFCVMAVSALAATPRLSAAGRAFLMMNTAATLWALGAFLQASAPRASFDAPLTAGWWSWMLSAMGYTAVPVAWFFLAAAQGRRYELLRRRSWLPLAAYVALTYTVVATNHLHGLLALPGSAVSHPRPGPLMLVVMPIALGLLVTSLWKVAAANMRGGSRMERRVGFALAATGSLPLIGSAAWAVGSRFMPAVPTDPTPMLAIPVTVVMAYSVVRLGLADLAPMAASQAFAAMSDAAVVVDPQLHILNANDVARRELAQVADAHTVAAWIPEVVPHVEACLTDRDGYVPFELRRHGAVYWGRAHRVGGMERPLGCVVLLSDITDLRYAQEQLESLLHKEEPEAVLLSRRADGA